MKLKLSQCYWASSAVSTFASRKRLTVYRLMSLHKLQSLTINVRICPAQANLLVGQVKVLFVSKSTSRVADLIFYSLWVHLFISLDKQLVIMLDLISLTCPNQKPEKALRLQLVSSQTAVSEITEKFNWNILVNDFLALSQGEDLNWWIVLALIKA